jgi:hypothetical protein
LDLPLFLALVEEIKPLLERNMFDSIARFKELQTLVAQTDIEAEITEIAAALATLRFDVALRGLIHLAERQSENTLP